MPNAPISAKREPLCVAFQARLLGWVLKMVEVIELFITMCRHHGQREVFPALRIYMNHQDVIMMLIFLRQLVASSLCLKFCHEWVRRGLGEFTFRICGNITLKWKGRWYMPERGNAN